MDIEFTTQDAEKMFEGWLSGSDSLLTLNNYQTIFEHAKSRMPDEVCEAHGFPLGTSYGHASRAAIPRLLINGVEHHLDTRISFDSEEQSLQWWRNNRDNPNRVTLRSVDGKWELEVAPIEGPANVTWNEQGF